MLLYYPPPPQKFFLQLVEVVIQAWNALFQALPLPRFRDDDSGFRFPIERIAGKALPMVEHALRESLSGGGGSQFSSEPEGFHDGQVGLDHAHGSTLDLRIFEHVASLPIQHSVDATNGRLGTLDFNQVDGFQEAGFGSEEAGVQDAPGGGDDLSAAPMDGVSVEGHVLDVEADAAHVLVTQHTFFRGPLEAGDDRVLDLVEILDSLGGVDENIGSGSFGTEAPDLTGFVHVVFVFVAEVTATNLEVLLVGDIAFVDILGETVGHGLSSEVKPVVLVG